MDWTQIAAGGAEIVSAIAISTGNPTEGAVFAVGGIAVVAAGLWQDWLQNNNSRTNRNRVL